MIYRLFDVICSMVSMVNKVITMSLLGLCSLRFHWRTRRNDIIDRRNKAAGSGEKRRDEGEREERREKREGERAIMAQRRKVPEGELCAVCCDLATGYHYGVASCNGCKTFFRRTIVSEQTFVCQYEGNCDVNKNIRCACRHCRFNKCINVGMDAKAIQNDRDRIGPTTKRAKLEEEEEADERQVENLLTTERLINRLRQCVLPEMSTVKDALTAPTIAFEANKLPIDSLTTMRELYPAGMKDIQMWNKREMRLCLEWAKTFPSFTSLSLNDQFALLRNFAFTFNLLNRNYYSIDHGPDKIVYQNGAYIVRHAQEGLQLAGARPQGDLLCGVVFLFARQMDEIMNPLRNMRITMAEFAAYKAAIFFNPDAIDLSRAAKPEVSAERAKYLYALFGLITHKYGIPLGAQKYGSLLMMTSSIQNIIAQNEENMQVWDVFQNWKIDPLVKELSMRSYSSSNNR